MSTSTLLWSKDAWRDSPSQMVPSTPLCSKADVKSQRGQDAVVPQCGFHENHLGKSSTENSENRTLPTAAATVASEQTRSDPSTPVSFRNISSQNECILVPDTQDAGVNVEEQVVPVTRRKGRGRDQIRARAAAILSPKDSSNVQPLNLFDFSTDYDIFA